MKKRPYLHHQTSANKAAKGIVLTKRKKWITKKKEIDQKRGDRYLTKLSM